jgi:hypothetical protein
MKTRHCVAACHLSACTEHHPLRHNVRCEGYSTSLSRDRLKSDSVLILQIAQALSALERDVNPRTWSRDHAFGRNESRLIELSFRPATAISSRPDKRLAPASLESTTLTNHQLNFCRCPIDPRWRLIQLILDCLLRIRTLLCGLSPALSAVVGSWQSRDKFVPSARLRRGSKNL